MINGAGEATIRPKCEAKGGGGLVTLAEAGIAAAWNSWWVLLLQ